MVQGMVETLLLQIGGLMLIQTLFMIWGGRAIVRIVNDGLFALDQSLGQALKQVLETGLGDFEPPNPILQAIASRLMVPEQVKPIEVRTKDDKGRFV